MAKHKRKFTKASVKREMAKELDAAVADLDIEERDLFGEDVMIVSIGRKEWMVVRDDDTARQIAFASVQQDLEQEPEIFNRSFIESHIDQEALKKWVWEAAMEDDYADEIARSEPERFWDEVSRLDIKIPKHLPDPVPQKYIDALKEDLATGKAENPMEFFEDIYGRNEAAKYAIDAVGIDVHAAAEEAIRVDGWQHFLSRYDGHSYETDSGFVYWREN